MNISKIRNFTIIAHVDHGKSTLADRIMEICNALPEREMKEQMLDNMSIERERGITIKAQTVRLKTKFNGEEYILNLIDTPGHVDFVYEVSRSLKACEISILLIDATKGVEAQTLSNFQKAVDAGHFIIPVINKVDLPTANLERCLEEILNLGLDLDLVHQISAKTGTGVKELIEKIIKYGPHPETNSQELRTLIVDSWYDKYLGVVTLVRVIDGFLKIGDKLETCSNKNEFQVTKLGIFTPKHVDVDKLSAGEIGFVVTQSKNPSAIRVGDTFIHLGSEAKALEGFKAAVPVVFCTLFPTDPDEAIESHEALKKYRLNDSAFSFELEGSTIFGVAFRCGFLGLLHMEIVMERIYREFEIDLMATIPSVLYTVHFEDGRVEEIKSANSWPSKDQIKYIEEPEVICSIMTTEEYIGVVTGLCSERRGEDISIDVQSHNKVIITSRLPLSEVILDFVDKLKTITSGFASFEYDLKGKRISDMCHLLILVNDEVVDELSFIVHRSKGRTKGQAIVDKLAEIIPRKQIKIKLQAAIDSVKNICARQDINPFRKDVISHCSGGDISRKKKLLEKQKAGKKFRSQFETNRKIILNPSEIMSIIKI